MEYHLILAHDLKMLKTEDYDRLSNEAIEVKRILASFLQKLKADG